MGQAVLAADSRAGEVELPKPAGARRIHRTKFLKLDAGFDLHCWFLFIYLSNYFYALVLPFWKKLTFSFIGPQS